MENLNRSLTTTINQILIDLSVADRGPGPHATTEGPPLRDGAVHKSGAVLWIGTTGTATTTRRPDCWNQQREPAAADLGRRDGTRLTKTKVTRERPQIIGP